MDLDRYQRLGALIAQEAEIDAETVAVEQLDREEIARRLASASLRLIIRCEMNMRDLAEMFAALYVETAVPKELVYVRRG